MKNLTVFLIVLFIITSGYLYSQEIKIVKDKKLKKTFIERYDTMVLMDMKTTNIFDTALTVFIPKCKYKKYISGKFIDRLKVVYKDYPFYSIRKFPVYLKKKRPPYELYDTALYLMINYKKPKK
ncbi:MAG: hypothetical protein KA792_02195 [Bacteroidales bacterium]|nr:hypothetical protein [Bacteroidales bacterium]